jgi:replication factor A1
MPKRVLQETDPLREFTHVRSLDRPPIGEAKVSRLRIRDLRAGMKRVSVKARVLEMLEPRLVFTRFGGCANVANALIADETGVMKLSLWNEQIRTVSVDNVIQIENARVAVFRGERQLRIGRHGKLRVVRDISFPSAQEIKKNLLRYSRYQV